VTSLARPKAILLDYGGTLVEELGYDPLAGAELMLSRAIVRPPSASIDAVVQRANRVTREVAARRTKTHVETPWPALTRLIYDYFGVEFDDSLYALELDFWKAAVTTRAMPGAAAALECFRRHGVRTAVVSNSSFGPDVIHYELDRHGLAEHLSFVMVSAEYAVRKPERLLFEAAGARIGARAEDIWFVGDSLDADIAGARAAGMKTIWLKSRGDDASGVADFIAADWQAVVAAFEACANSGS
jgi:putative hydrolase of the HAD superfamily